MTFRDEVTLVRVLDDGKANFDMGAFKKTLEAELRQESVLIVEREVGVFPKKSNASTGAVTREILTNMPLAACRSFRATDFEMAG